MSENCCCPISWSPPPLYATAQIYAKTTGATIGYLDLGWFRYGRTAQGLTNCTGRIHNGIYCHAGRDASGKAVAGLYRTDSWEMFAFFQTTVDCTWCDAYTDGTYVWIAIQNGTTGSPRTHKLLCYRIEDTALLGTLSAVGTADDIARCRKFMRAGVTSNLQLGPMGEYDQTAAEIVAGAYSADGLIDPNARDVYHWDLPFGDNYSLYSDITTELEVDPTTGTYVGQNGIVWLRHQWSAAPADLEAYPFASGTVSWTKSGFVTSTSIDVVGGSSTNIYVRHNGTLYQLDAGDGTTNWSNAALDMKLFESSDIANRIALEDLGKSLVFLYCSGFPSTALTDQVYGLDIDAGTVTWSDSSPVPDHLNDIDQTEDLIIVSGSRVLIP